MLDQEEILVYRRGWLYDKLASYISQIYYGLPIIQLSSNRHMEHRIFGRQITNVAEQEQLRAKRNYSFLHNDKLRENKATLSARNRNLLMPATKHQEQKTTPADPQMVPEYFEQNLCYLRSQETKNPTFGNYISDHKSVSQNSRAKLLDWLSELHYKYKMFPETIFTVVAFIDRYLAKKTVPLGELQLVGIAALLIAAKFQQTYQVPHLKQLIAASAGQYTATQLTNMEADMLNVFNFQLITNSSYKFFEPLAKVAELQPKNVHLGQYVLELALTKPKFLAYEPSMLACATIYLIKKIRRSETAWSEQLSKMINYRESELKTCAKQLCSLLEQAPTLQSCKALKKKFSLPDFHEVTKIKLQRKK